MSFSISSNRVTHEQALPNGIAQGGAALSLNPSHEMPTAPSVGSEMPAMALTEVPFQNNVNQLTALGTVSAGGTHPHIQDNELQRDIHQALSTKPFSAEANNALLTYLKGEGCIKADGGIDFLQVMQQARAAHPDEIKMSDAEMMAAIAQAKIKGTFTLRSDGSLSTSISGVCCDAASQILEALKSRVEAFTAPGADGEPYASQLSLNLPSMGVKTPSSEDLSVLQSGGQITYKPVGDQKTLKLVVDPRLNESDGRLNIAVMDNRLSHLSSSCEIPLSSVFEGKPFNDNRALVNGSGIWSDWRAGCALLPKERSYKAAVPFTMTWDALLASGKDTMNDPERLKAQTTLWEKTFDYLSLLETSQPKLEAKPLVGNSIALLTNPERENLTPAQNPLTFDHISNEPIEGEDYKLNTDHVEAHDDFDAEINNLLNAFNEVVAEQDVVLNETSGPVSNVQTKLEAKTIANNTVDLLPNPQHEVKLPQSNVNDANFVTSPGVGQDASDNLLEALNHFSTALKGLGQDASLNASSQDNLGAAKALTEPLTQLLSNLKNQPGSALSREKASSLRGAVNHLKSQSVAQDGELLNLLNQLEEQLRSLSKEEHANVPAAETATSTDSPLNVSNGQAFNLAGQNVVSNEAPGLASNVQTKLEAKPIAHSSVDLQPNPQRELDTDKTIAKTNESETQIADLNAKLKLFTGQMNIIRNATQPSLASIRDCYSAAKSYADGVLNHANSELRAAYEQALNEKLLVPLEKGLSEAIDNKYENAMSNLPERDAIFHKRLSFMDKINHLVAEQTRRGRTL